MKHAKIILASASPRRIQLMKQIGIKFDAVAPDIDEIPGLYESPEQFSIRMSYEKALSVYVKVAEPVIVIGADTVVALDEIMQKPQTREEAEDMLMKLSGRWHEVITGLTVMSGTDRAEYSSVYEVTRVKMRQIGKKLCDAYINTGEPMDKAGAYGIQGMGALLVEKTDGCFYNVVGLPLFRLVRELENADVDIPAMIMEQKK